MKAGTTPNNDKWGIAQSLLPNESIYEHDEFNSWTLDSAKDQEVYPSPEVSGYSDADHGSSLHETQYAGVLNSSKIQKMVSSITKIGVAAIAAVSIFAVIQKGIPQIKRISVEEWAGQRVVYSFSATVEYSATIHVLFENNGSTLELETRPLELKTENLFEGYVRGYSGEYKFTITYEGYFGRGSLYSKKGVLR